MADFTTFQNGEPIGRGAGANAASYPAFTVFEHTFDSAERNVTNGDRCTEFIKLPEGSFVLGVMVHVLEAEAIVTLDVGDATDPDGYVAAQSLAATGRFAGAGAYIAADTDTSALEQPQFLSAETWLSFTIGGADATVAKFRVAVLVGNAG